MVSYCAINRVEKATPNTRPKNLAVSPVSMRIAIQIMQAAPDPRRSRAPDVERERSSSVLPADRPDVAYPRLY